jgi:glyoxylase-like metal-dependent hydrolase (beta-lactamase superfamily II)
VSDTPPLPADIARIRLPLPAAFEIPSVNAYLLKGEPLTLVDAGPQSDESFQALVDGLNVHGVRVEDIELVLLTHQHEDHVGMAQAVAQQAGATIVGTPKLARLLLDYDASMNIEDRYIRTTMLRHGMDTEIAADLERTFRSFRRFVRSAEITQLVDEGSTVFAGGREFTVLRAPGHSPTDTLFLSMADRVLLGGDHLLERISSNPIAHWPIDDRRPEDSAAAPDRREALVEYLESLRRTNELSVSLVLPGHGAPFTDHRGTIERRINMHARRADAILDSLNGALSAADLGRRMWRDSSGFDGYLVLSEVLGHLDLLKRSGKVQDAEEGEIVRWKRLSPRNGASTV